jgi:glycosyltransferase involved in cell wall biosynthesis
LGINDNVVFTGFRKDIPKILGALDIFVTPTLSEALGTAILEAMAAGKPVVATYAGSNPESVIDGVTGILVPPKDPESLAKAIFELMESPEKSRMMGEMGKQRAKEYFSIEKMVHEYEEFYDSFENKTQTPYTYN